MLGDRETHDRLVREIAIGAQATVVFVEYTRSPEAMYPVATEQAYTATAWVAEQGASMGVDASRLAVVGDGTEGTLTTVTTLLARGRGGPPIALTPPARTPLAQVIDTWRTAFFHKVEKEG